MSDQEFKVGDIVELLSGGPPMTVTEVNTNLLGHTEIVCRWWRDKMEKDTFDPKHMKPGKALSFFELRSMGGGFAAASDEGAVKSAE